MAIQLHHELIIAEKKVNNPTSSLNFELFIVKGGSPTSWNLFMNGATSE